MCQQTLLPGLPPSHPGNLALSRAIGDFNFKENADLPAEEQIITADPEIVVVDMTPRHEFIVLACDGESACLTFLGDHVWQQVLVLIAVLDDLGRLWHRCVGCHVQFRGGGVREEETGAENAASSGRNALWHCRPASSVCCPYLQICEALLDHCLAPDCRMGGLGCDNMTVILACILHDGELYSDLCQRCADTVSNVQQPDDSPRPQAKSNGGLPQSDQDSLPVSPKLGGAWPRTNGLGITAAVEVSVGRKRNASSSSSSEGDRSTDIDEEMDRAESCTDEAPTTCTDALEGPDRAELETAV